jgi:hypothetical protein
VISGLFSQTLKSVLFFFSKAEYIITIKIKAYLPCPHFRTLLDKTSVTDLDDSTCSP